MGIGQEQDTDRMKGLSQNARKILDTTLAGNYLLGVEGDRINVILWGCDYNIRRPLRAIVFWLYETMLGGRFYRSAVLTVVARDRI